MLHDQISDSEREKTELKLPVIVYLHADRQDEVEVRDRISQIRSVIETALADEDNDLLGFCYPEVRLEEPRT